MSHQHPCTIFCARMQVYPVLPAELQALGNEGQPLASAQQQVGDVRLCHKIIMLLFRHLADCLLNDQSSSFCPCHTRLAKYLAAAPAVCMLVHSCSAALVVQGYKRFPSLHQTKAMQQDDTYNFQLRTQEEFVLCSPLTCCCCLLLPSMHWKTRGYFPHLPMRMGQEIRASAGAAAVAAAAAGGAAHGIAAAGQQQVGAKHVVVCWFNNRFVAQQRQHER